MKIILTRSPKQNEHLRRGILECNMKLLDRDIISLPLLKAEPITPGEMGKQTILGLDQFDDIFFISKNAVAFGLDQLEQYWPQWPILLRWFAVGSGTSSALGPANVEVIYPHNASSEGLLGMPELEHMAERKCLIVRGIGGRETLKEGLEARGAQVSYLETYQRVPIEFSVAELPQVESNQPELSQPELSQAESSHAKLSQAESSRPESVEYEEIVALLYSGEALSHFLSRGGANVLQYQLIVPSQRLLIMANDLGFAKVELANSQEDHAMLQVLQQMRRRVS